LNNEKLTQSGSAFFFQGDNILLPEVLSDTQIDVNKVPLFPIEQANLFNNPDIFETPSLEAANPVSMIQGVSVSSDTVLPPKWRAVPVRSVLTIFATENNMESKLLWQIIRASHIAQWRRDSCFCGTCGAKNEDVSGHEERKCPNCGRLEFPRICPAIIVLITDAENRILLAHNKRFKEGLYSHISGFNEAGESLEETVVREVREEINIEVKDIEYVKSQPWPFPNSLMVGFKARYASGTIKPDGEEIEDARWFTKDNMPYLPSKGSLARSIIDDWLKSF